MVSLATTSLLHADRVGKRPTWTKTVLTFMRNLGDVIAEAREMRRTMHKRHPFVDF